MWATPNGVRTLKGAEAAMIRAIIESMAGDLETGEEVGDEVEYGVKLFDQLQLRQQFAMLALVGSALLLDEVSPPKPNAVNEATIATLFAALQESLEAEIINNDPPISSTSTYWRTIVLAAAREADEIEVRLPRPTSKARGEWEELISDLAEALIWDLDWEMADTLTDLDPEAARSVKQFLTIDDDYYVEIAPDPSDEELEKIRELLRRITNQA